MNRRFLTIAASLFVALVVFQSAAFAHEVEKHGRGHKAGAQMQKLHDMMPVYAQAQAKFTEALKKGDAKTVETETGKILATTADLKKAKPHKNLKELQTFKGMAIAFEEDVKTTAALAKKGDFEGAKAAFKKAEEKCTECHTKFRD